MTELSLTALGKKEGRRRRTSLRTIHQHAEAVPEEEEEEEADQLAAQLGGGGGGAAADNDCTLWVGRVPSHMVSGSDSGRATKEMISQVDLTAAASSLWCRRTWSVVTTTWTIIQWPYPG